MVKCGIRKYDLLPSSINIIDVDYHRYKLYKQLRKKNQIQKHTIKALRPIRRYRLNRINNKINKTMKILNLAVLINENRSRNGHYTVEQMLEISKL